MSKWTPTTNKHNNISCTSHKRIKQLNHIVFMQWNDLEKIVQKNNNLEPRTKFEKLDGMSDRTAWHLSIDTDSPHWGWYYA